MPDLTSASDGRSRFSREYDVVTVRQFSRGLGRSVRAMERSAARAQRQRLMDEKAEARQAMLDASADAAAAHDDLMAFLVEGHRTRFKRRDWRTLAGTPPPEDPVHSDERERRAAQVLAAYRPTWLAKTFRREARALQRLQAEVDRARTADAEAHLSASEDAAQQRDQIAFAQAVIRGEAEAIIAAVRELADLDQIAVDDVRIHVAKGRVVAFVDALELEDMPSQQVTLLQSGKASVKPISSGKRLELHRDSICSAAVRVAVEFLDVLPVDAVEVVMAPDMLDPATGHIVAQPVLYLRATAQALATVNLSRAEPTPLAQGLGAHFDWTRREGLRPIDLAPFDLPEDQPVVSFGAD